MRIKGYKGFDKDLQCRGYQYEVGKTYKTDKNILLCNCGFHFCKELFDVNEFYDFNTETNRFCEIEAVGQVFDDENSKKSVTNHIKIIREIPKEELLKLTNMGSNNLGYWNTGNCNTGHRNTGDRNTGDRNTGDWNTGDRNTGHCNTGHCNTGDRNTGDWNTGDRNTGDWNTGDRNTGDWNKANRSAGVFCNEEPKMMMFNKSTEMSYSEWQDTKAYNILNYRIEICKWIFYEDMTVEEKLKYPSAETCGGYLKKLSRKEQSKNMWSKLDISDKLELMTLPNFDLDVFNDIMELNITEEEYIDILESNQ